MALLWGLCTELAGRGPAATPPPVETPPPAAGDPDEPVRSRVRAEGQLGPGAGVLLIDVAAPRGAKLTLDAPVSARGSGGIGLSFPRRLSGPLNQQGMPLRLPIEDRIVLSGAMTRLKALEQKVLYEFFYQDLSQTEIARKMDISCNYVSHILKNSTLKLRRKSSGGGGEGNAAGKDPAAG